MKKIPNFQPQVLDDSTQWVDQRLLSMQKQSMQLVPFIGRGQQVRTGVPVSSNGETPGRIYIYIGWYREGVGTLSEGVCGLYRACLGNGHFPIHLVSIGGIPCIKNTWSKGLSCQNSCRKWVELRNKRGSVLKQPPKVFTKTNLRINTTSRRPEWLFPMFTMTLEFFLKMEQIQTHEELLEAWMRKTDSWTKMVEWQPLGG